MVGGCIWRCGCVSMGFCWWHSCLITCFFSWSVILSQLHIVACRNLPTTTVKIHTEENGHELNQRAIGLWKYICTVILAYMKNQVKKHFKVDNSVKNQKSKTSKSNSSKAWKGNRYYMIYIMIQTSLFLLFNIMINILSNTVSIWSIFWYGDNLAKFRNIKKHFWISKYDVSIHPSVILQLIMSSQRSLGIPKNTFVSKYYVIIHPSVILYLMISSKRV